MLSNSYKTTSYSHGGNDITAVLLVNLGTPAAPTTAAVRRYLKEFLSDPRVIELPWWLWWPILHGVILRIRPSRSAHAYRQIWTEQGSPLLRLSVNLTHRLGERLQARQLGGLEAHLAMRYGSPSIASVLDGLRARNLRRLLVLPLYPQYSATTTASVFDAVCAQLRQWRFIPEMRFINDYWRSSAYLSAIAKRIVEFRAAFGTADRVLFSFHGIPQRYFFAGDPYYCQCQGSVREIATLAGLNDSQWAIGFQSRVGREKWLEPYTEQLLVDWARQGVKHVQVVCPGFAVDCLETLEEIAIKNKAAFLAAGGTRFDYIPALNAEADHAEMLADLVETHIEGWPMPASKIEIERRQQRHDALKAGMEGK